MEVIPVAIGFAIHSFKPGSAAGPDKLSFQHQLLSQDKMMSSSCLLETLTDLANLMLAGKVTYTISQILYGANLIDLNKADGRIRPIAVGTW